MTRRLCLALLFLLTCLTSTKAGKQVEGVFSKKLKEPGYYLVTSIPKASKSINVTDLSRTVNFLAVRLENGSYLFNEEYNVSSSGKYLGAGTNFIYIRRNDYNPETFYAAGPLDSTIDVMLIYQQYEPKIVYQYELPDELKLSTMQDIELESLSTTNFVSTISENVMMRDETRSSTVAMPKKRRRRRKFIWSSPGFTACDKPCAGGYQKKRFICIRQRDRKQMSSKKCESQEKPRSVIIRCNNSPCPPEWEAGPWSKCSVSCGQGVLTRQLQCIRKMPDSLNVRVENSLCQSNSSGFELQKPCHMPDCQIYKNTVAKPAAPSRWKTDEWSPCSVSCGNGTRTRNVSCVKVGKPCDSREKPAAEEPCDMAACQGKPVMGNEIPEALTTSSWLYSAWPDECSAECGTGMKSRRLYCENYLKNETCDEAKMPTPSIICVSSHVCGQWFVGPWTKCSSSCDVGVEMREVACVSKFLGLLKVVPASNCPGSPPETFRGCMGPPCNSTWFMSDWTPCSRSCGHGSQEREVRCIGPDGVPTSPGEMECDEERRPPSKRQCNSFSCNAKQTTAAPDSQAENEVDLDCRDYLGDCWAVRSGSQEARQKCQMELYKKGCCKACQYASFLRSIRGWNPS